jgi:hypothetical protein
LDKNLGQKVSENAEKEDFCDVLEFCGFVIKFAGARLLSLDILMFLIFIRTNNFDTL